MYYICTMNLNLIKLCIFLWGCIRAWRIWKSSSVANLIINEPDFCYLKFKNSFKTYSDKSILILDFFFGKLKIVTISL